MPRILPYNLEPFQLWTDNEKNEMLLYLLHLLLGPRFSTKTLPTGHKPEPVRLSDERCPQFALMAYAFLRECYLLGLGGIAGWLDGFFSGGDLFSVLYHRSPYVCLLRMRMFTCLLLIFRVCVF